MLKKEKTTIKCDRCGYIFPVNLTKSRSYVYCPRCKKQHRIKPTLRERFGLGKKKAK